MKDKPTGPSVPAYPSAWRVLSLAVSLLLCTDQAWAQAALRPPIVVGAVSSLSGPVAFPESTDAVRAYFEVVNAAGGVQGRPLKLVVEDDKGDPEEARQAARKLVGTLNVVAQVGSASIVDCAANAAEYARRGIVSIQGTGVEPACFESANIAPVNTGPYLSVATALQFAVDVLKRQRPCVLLLDLQGTVPAYQRVIADWSQRAGRKPALVAVFTGGTAPALLWEQVVRERCDAVVYTGVEPMVIGWMQAGRDLPDLTAMPRIFLTPAYTDRVASALGDATASPIYAMSEFEPWSSRSGWLSDWRAVMRGSKVPLSSFSQGGYMAAQVFVRLLRGIRGEITRASVTDAFKQMPPMELASAGTPFQFGEGDTHNPNRATLPVRLDNGRWRIAHHRWIVVPE